jgi:hypothetical protein
LVAVRAILRDEREEAVLDLVPLAGARRQVTDGKGYIMPDSFNVTHRDVIIAAAVCPYFVSIGLRVAYRTVMRTQPVILHARRSLNSNTERT